MNLKIYEKTRYQNIYRHKKNKNYIIKINTPIDTTVTSINGSKIFKIDDAVKIRDNPKIKIQKTKEIAYKDEFNDLWQKYIYYCINEDKQAYNTWHKKQIMYNAYFKNKINQRVAKINKDFLIRFINDTECSLKQKNELMKQLKTFFNWCIKEEYLINNPMTSIQKFKTEKPKMKYWEPTEIKQFFNYINQCIDNNIDKEIAYRIKILVILGIVLGDRIGETRALTFGNIDKKKMTIDIVHSINYNTKSNDFLSTTKNYWSQRQIDVSNAFINEIDNYKLYLKSIGYEINDNTLIFLNHNTKRPLNDCSLRKEFNRYCKQANVTKIRMYDLRHTYVASMMSEGKELYLFSERIGHKSFSTTINKYGHLTNKVRKEMAEITDKFIK